MRIHTLEAARFAVSQIKREAAVQSRTSIKCQVASVKIFTNSGNLVGMATLDFGRLVGYRIRSITVSQPNEKRGFGRLLQIEAAILASERGLWFKWPPFAYTAEGKIAFNGYPYNCFRLLQSKIPLARKLQKPVIDKPWEDPKVSLPASSEKCFYLGFHPVLGYRV